MLRRTRQQKPGWLFGICMKPWVAKTPCQVGCGQIRHWQTKISPISTWKARASSATCCTMPSCLNITITEIKRQKQMRLVRVFKKAMIILFFTGMPVLLSAQVNPFDIKKFEFIDYDENSFVMNNNQQVGTFFSKMDSLILLGMGKI